MKTTILRILRTMRLGATPVTVCAVMLGLIGVLAVFNATYHMPSPTYYVVRQAVWLLVGGTLAFLLAGMPARVWRRRGPWLAVPALAALLGVFVWGVRIHRMRGWYQFPGFLVQPGELAKPFFVLALAWLLVCTADHRRRFVAGYLPLLAFLALWVVPLALQPDFGTLLVYLATFSALVLVAGVPLAHLALTAAAALPLGFAAWTAVPYLRIRVIGFLRPEQFADSAGWHILQFRRTLASGGLRGRTWGDCIWSRTHLPLGHTDSMFATVGEAMGFLGVLPLLALLGAWIAYVSRRSRQMDDPFAATAAMGLMALVAGQALIHLSVNLGLMPVTGLTLPLFSYGGSSMIATMTCVGICESLLRRTPPANEAP